MVSAVLALLLTPAGVYVAMLVAMQAMLLLGGVTFLLPAPMGKWGPRARRVSLNANLGWVLMEIPGPVLCLLAMCSAPTAPPLAWSPSLLSPQVTLPAFLRLLCPGLLAASDAAAPPLSLPARWWGNFSAHPPTRQAAALFYLAHYMHRALLQPLWRAPRRTPMAIQVSLSAMLFQTTNGFLIGTWLASRAPQSVPPGVPGHTWAASLASAGQASLAPSTASSFFWLWMTLAALGLTSNIFHDEILLALRRPGRPREPKKSTIQVGRQTYTIPHGGLFTYIDHPHYLSEWAEWAFWGVAAVSQSLSSPASAWTWLSCPPTLFPLVEVAVMLPRALRGHEWYRSKFGKLYPARRRAIVPFLL